MKYIYLTITATLFSLLGYCQNNVEEIQLSQMSIAAIKQEVLAPAVNSSMTGERIMINGKVYFTGISVHAPSSGNVYLGGKGVRFKANVGVDDVKNRRPKAANMESLVSTSGIKTFFYTTETGQPRRLIGIGNSLEDIQPGSVEFTITGDGKKIWSSGVMKQGDAPLNVDIDVSGIQMLKMEVSDANDGNSGDVGNWANARIVVLQGAGPRIVPEDYLSSLNKNDKHFKAVLKPELQLLPAYNPVLAKKDWLLEKPVIKATVTRLGEKAIVMSNGLVSRTIHVSPNAATISLKNLGTGEEYIRSVKPEAHVTIDSVDYAIGGLAGQIDQAYFLPKWIDRMYSIPQSFTLDRFEIVDVKERFPWKNKRWIPATQWKLSGKELILHFKHASINNVMVDIHYEIYDNIPLFSKWIVVNNKGNKNIRVNDFTSEIIAHHETENYVASPKDWHRPNLYIENDYAFGGFTYEESVQSIVWEKDSAYTSQGNYAMTMPCILKSKPSIGPNVLLKSGDSLETFRTFLMPLDGTDKERNTLSQRKMYRTLAPWSTENPIFMHLTSTNPEIVKTAVDQCVATGYEMIILSFGSGLNMENQSEANITKFKELSQYAHSKGIEIGGYSLLSSRRISDEHDVINVKTGKPGGAIYGNAPCLESEWGIEYFKKLQNFFIQTGFDILEHDGSYPGDFCASEKHPGHEGYFDSQWKQWKKITTFYKWLRSEGVYTNIPDFYFLSGSNKCSIGYREVNWSLPRDQQLILGRQNIYDGTWTRTPSMGWTFVPLVQYHGGGAAATLEPLSEHLGAYGAHMEQNYGSGVQACYRGNRLYDTTKAKLLVQQKINHYKKYREILNADIIHLKRPTGRDWDGILHVDPTSKERGYALLFNPLDTIMNVKLKLPLYYTALNGMASIRVENQQPKLYRIDRQNNVEIAVTIPANGSTWMVVEKAK
ncbi:MAG: NPCBM/NEW2 domain-containing protein [Chitinophagaceae bacterium]